jgi:PBP1b-binding outer membrane lipoprotein LpoB
MKMKWMALSGMIILALLLAACSPAVEAPQAMEDKPAVETTMEDTAPVQDEMKSDGRLLKRWPRKMKKMKWSSQP